MNILEKNELDQLIADHPLLTQERREKIVEHLTSISSDERQRVFDIFAQHMPEDEFAFVKACCGQPDAIRPLASLEPTETPLVPTTPLYKGRRRLKEEGDENV